MDRKWSESIIAASLSKDFFRNKNLIVVPNCYWTGDECDLLVVTPSLKLIDIEIKISKKDYLADGVKYKWKKWDSVLQQNIHRDWPIYVWKHYYCMPSEIWKDEMLDKLPSNQSGVILIDIVNDNIKFTMLKNAKANTKAKPIDARDAIDIARLASIRMWRAVEEINSLRELLNKKNSQIIQESNT